ncbi:MAG: DNA polymerase III subunit alpha [Bacteroidota bacterium]|nr:DNA polymerase III subunit alpha [Bacteroidota bacterium]
MSDFIHLHNHTHYSLQDGACTVPGLIKAAQKYDMPAVALTDHGVMYGISEFYKKATAAGIKPIIGIEAYITEGSRFSKGKSEDTANRKHRSYYHIVLLAKNQTGYKNLMKLTSRGFTEGFYYKPRIDLELLRQYSEGLVCTSACAGGIVAAHLVNNDIEKARATAITYKELFGDDFYLEIQDHNMEVEKPVLEWMPKLAKELNIKLVATNDCHYIEREHAVAHNILLLLSDKTGKDYRELRYGTDQIYFKSADEMKALFKDYKGAIENTLEINEKIELKFGKSKYLFPQFPIPADSPAQDLDGYLRILATEGLHKKITDVTPDVKERFEFELETIKNMGYSGYFLIVQDFINASKRLGVSVGPGRGSAAGSLVAYALNITQINPLDYDLLFERFLNPSRNSMPDIDIDFADDVRGKAIDYVKEKYGTECVCQIITFNTLSTKAVLKDVGRVLGIPIPTIDKINKFIPSVFGKVYSIEQALKEVPELKWVNESTDENIHNLIKYAKILEGMNRNSSKHAAGVVITPEDVSNFVPLATATSSDEVITQFNMKEVEGAGLLKMDFLGLRTLSIIKTAVEFIKKNHGVDLDIEAIPIDDEKTYQLFSKGQTTGVFQFESSPMREFLKKLNPTSLKDLSAMNALYRPGPMKYIDTFIDRKFGNQEVTYLHPLLEPILKETYGIIVYQEQVIQIANRLAGMTLAEADILRRAMGKKDLVAMAQQRTLFVDLAGKKEIPKNIAGEIFDLIQEFANYGFNKSHAVAYSLVAYRTAYLKAHYTAEFLAANLTHEFGNKAKVADLLNDCRKLKIDVLPPDVNHPSVSFNVESGKIRFGMSAIKNVGIKAVEEVMRSRKELNRDFTSIYDFTSNVDVHAVNKRALEGLVLAGAFDSINTHRFQLFSAIEDAIAYKNKISGKKSLGDSLFGDDHEDMQLKEPALPKLPPWNETEKLSHERDVLGFYLTGHPLRKYEVDYNSFSNVRLGEAEELEKLVETENAVVKLCGVIVDIKTKIDKAGNNMAFFKIEDFSGSCESMMFSKIYDRCGRFVKEEACVFVTGKPESSGDAIKIRIEDMIPMEDIRQNYIESIAIDFYKNKDDISLLKKVKPLLEDYKGKIPVFILFYENGSTPICYQLEYRVNLSDVFLNRLIALFGEDNITFKGKNITRK